MDLRDGLGKEVLRRLGWVRLDGLGGRSLSRSLLWSWEEEILIKGLWIVPSDSFKLNQD